MPLLSLPSELVREIFNRLSPVDKLSFTMGAGVQFGPIPYDPLPNRTKTFLAALVLKLLTLVPAEAALAVAHGQLRASPFLAPSRLRASTYADRAGHNLATMSVPALRLLAAYLLTVVAAQSCPAKACGGAFSVVDRLAFFGMRIRGDDWSRPRRHIRCMSSSVFLQLLMLVQRLTITDLPDRLLMD